MLDRKQILTHFFLPLLLMIVSGSQAAMAQSLRLYTPYPRITVPPGETIDYAIDLINNGGAIATAEVGVEGLPEGWKQTLRSGGWNAQAISVLPREKKSLNLKVELPFDIEKGLYTFRVTAAATACCRSRWRCRSRAR